jgi:uncharacterized integral membrane protein
MTDPSRSGETDAAGTTSHRPDPVPIDTPDTAPTAPAQPPSAPVAPAAGPSPTRPAVPGTRTGRLWIGLIVAAVVFVLLLVFIVQNSGTVEINFMGMHGHMSLAVALLLATASGMLLVAIPGTGRIMQLRRRLRRRTRPNRQP